MSSVLIFYTVLHAMSGLGGESLRIPLALGVSHSVRWNYRVILVIIPYILSAHVMWYNEEIWIAYCSVVYKHIKRGVGNVAVCK